MFKWNHDSTGSDSRRVAQHVMTIEKNSPLSQCRSDSYESDDFIYDEQSETTVGISIQKTETSPILGQGLLAMNANYRSTMNVEDETVQGHSTSTSNSYPTSISITDRSVLDRFLFLFPWLRFQPATPLQEAMRRSRRIRYLRSARFWSMVVSVAILVCTVGYYYFSFIGGYNAIISNSKNGGYRVKFERINSKRLISIGY